jgi:peptidoglycan/LPS O-acetylase OafA/YrhL
MPMSRSVRHHQGTSENVVGRWTLGHRPALDGLRGIAILLVLANHAGVPLTTNAGQVGVTLFFGLSGFLISRILIEELRAHGKIDFPKFFRRRAIRLLPALAVVIVASVPILVLTVPGGSASDVIPALLYFANWDQIVAGREALVVGHTWSLSVEEHFYLVWPAVVPVLGRLFRSPWVLVTACLLVASLFAAERFALWEPTKEAFYRTLYGTDTRADALLIGAALAALFELRPVRPPIVAIVGAIAVLSVVVLTPSPGALITVGLLLSAVATAVLVASGATISHGILTSRLLVLVGLISYGLYLWHVPMLHLMRALLGTGFVASSVGIALTFAAATASWLWVERPMRRYRTAGPDRSSSAPVTVP